MRTRFVTLYTDHVAGTVAVHVQRLGVYGKTLTNRYMLHRGEPSVGRLGALLCGRKHTNYPAQLGWGVTPENGRARSTWLL